MQGQLTIDFSIGQIHHQPIRENKVKRALGEVEHSDIGLQECDVAELGSVGLLVGIDEGLHEIDGSHVRGNTSKLAGEAPYACPQFEDALVLKVWQTFQDLGELGLVQVGGVRVEHHCFDSGS